jgi:RPA family protein
MSDSGSDDINRREVAYRLFAAEFEDANYSYAESDEERAPNYVVTPTGARVNRVFVVGVLTEVEQVSDDVVRARVVDPTGAFVIYAGQYQPEALAALESANTPSFVAVTGKARTFQPDDADVVYTSIRPEEVSEVDAETRDRWVVATAEQTVDRVSTMAAAHERVERGENLQRILADAGVQPGLAAGIPLALDHYGTTPDYLDAVRELALDAARVVAGDLDEAGELSLSPGDGGDAALPYAANLDVEAVPSSEDTTAASEAETGDAAETAAAGAQAEPADEGAPAADAESASDATEADEPADEEAAEAEPSEATTEAAADSDQTAGPVDADFGEPDGEDAEVPDGDVHAEATMDTDEEVTAESESEAAADDDVEPEPAEKAAVDATPAAETPDPGDVAEEASPADAEAAGDDEMYELSEEERQEVKENYDVEFSSGTDIPESADDEGEPAEAPAEAEPTEAPAEAEPTEAPAEAEPTEAPAEAEPTEAPAAGEAEDELGDFDADDEAGEPDLDLEDYVVDLMDSLDDGDGALREDVVATAADELDADEGEVEDAIQDALMSGRCYESGDDHLKAI